MLVMTAGLTLESPFAARSKAAAQTTSLPQRAESVSMAAGR